MSPKALVFVLLSTLSLGADQLSKWQVREQLALSVERVEVIPGFFELVHVENTGAAFGLLSGWEHAMWLFGVFTLAALGVLVSLYRECPEQARWTPAALALILAGAVGNGVDRLHKQAVTDFLRVYVDHEAVRTFLRKNLGAVEWPSFNVADVSISVGVGMFLVAELFLRRKGARPQGG